VLATKIGYPIPGKRAFHGHRDVALEGLDDPQ